MKRNYERMSLQKLQEELNKALGLLQSCKYNEIMSNRISREIVKISNEIHNRKQLFRSVGLEA